MEYLTQFPEGNSFDIPHTLGLTLVQRDSNLKAISAFYGRGRIEFGLRIWYEAPADEYERYAREIAALFEPLNTFDFYPHGSYIEVGFTTSAKADLALRKPLCSGLTLLHKVRPCGEGETFHILRITQLPNSVPLLEIRQILIDGVRSYGRILGIFVQADGQHGELAGPVVYVAMAQRNNATLRIPIQAMLLGFSFKVEMDDTPVCYICSRYGHYRSACTAGCWPKFSILWGA